jgi:hypothetical protein
MLRDAFRSKGPQPAPLEWGRCTNLGRSRCTNALLKEGDVALGARAQGLCRKSPIAMPGDSTTPRMSAPRPPWPPSHARNAQRHIVVGSAL